MSSQKGLTEREKQKKKKFRLDDISIHFSFQFLSLLFYIFFFEFFYVPFFFSIKFMTASRLNFYLRVHPSSFIKSQLGNVIENIILQLLPIPILLLVSTMPTRCLSFSASFFSPSFYKEKFNISRFSLARPSPSRPPLSCN